MDNQRTFYSAFIIMMTVLTVGFMLNMRITIDSPETYNQPEIKIEDKEKEIEDRRIDITNNEDKDNTAKEESQDIISKKEAIEISTKRKTTSNFGKTPKYILFKEKRITDDMEKSFVDYDDETRAYLLTQLEEGIKRAKLDNFEGLLNQEEVIETMKVAEVEERLTSKEKNALASIIDKIGTTSNIKLMAMFANGVTPKEQKKIYDLLKSKLSDDEIVELHDILGGYMKK